MSLLWDVLLLFVGLGFAGIGAVNLGTAPLWFGAAGLCAIALVIDAIRRRGRLLRRDISEVWALLYRLRGPAAEHRRYANTAARTASKIFQTMAWNLPDPQASSSGPFAGLRNTTSYFVPRDTYGSA